MGQGSISVHILFSVMHVLFPRSSHLCLVLNGRDVSESWHVVEQDDQEVHSPRNSVRKETVFKTKT